MAERSHRSLIRTLGRRLGQTLERAAEEDATVEEAPPADVLEMLRRLGGAMCDGGDATDYIAEHLERIADAYDARGVSFFALPTGVFVRIDLGDTSASDFAPAGGQSLRLDQIGAVYDLVRLAERRQVEPVEVVARLDAILASEPRFGWPLRTLGLVGTVVGLGLLLNPDAKVVPLYLPLALVVAAVEALAQRVRTLEVVLPVLTAFVVSWASYAFLADLVDAEPTDVLIPPLIMFLPGAALTIGTVELSARSMVSGSARLMFGFERLLLLAVGIAAGAALAGDPDGPITPPDQLGWWAPWFGLLVFGLGHYVHSPAPRGSFGWLMVILTAAYVAQVVGFELWGTYVSGFVGALVVPPLALWVESRRNGPPGIVTFLPAFWMLVPGALGVAGVSEIVGADAAAGLAELTDTLLTVVAIAMGVVVGTSLSNPTARGFRRSA